MVQQIKGCRTEAERYAFRHAKALLQRGVNFERTGSVRDESPQIPPRAVRRRREGRRIEPVVDRLVRRIDRHAGNQVRALA